MWLLKTSPLLYRRGLKSYSAARRAEPTIVVINGHPDPRPERFCAGLCQAFVEGALAERQKADVVTIGAISGTGFKEANDLVRRADRAALIFPLWLDGPPPIVSRFFEHFAGGECTAHVFVTMAMPAFAHRSLHHPQRGNQRASRILPSGVRASALTFIGSIDTLTGAQRQSWLDKVQRLGKARSRQ